MNLLDFAGQNVFYNSHQFFLTRKSIYFLVFNANSLDFTSNISYWLKTLSNQIQGRPLPNVFLIGTHIDEIPEENREASMEKIKKELSNFCKSLKHTINIKGISLICSTKRQDVDYLKEQLTDFIIEQKIHLQQIPTFFEKMRKQVEEKKKTYSFPVLLFDTFSQKYSNYEDAIIKIHYPEDIIRKAINYLNEMGTIIYIDTPQLRDWIILDPRWLANRMADIISFKTNFPKGIIPQNFIEKIWTDSLSSNEKSLLLDLFERFEIIFKKSSTQEYIIPSMLPTKPNGDITQEVKKQTKYKRIFLFKFIPIGFFSRLIVFLLHQNNIESVHIWKTGVILKRKDAVAMIEESGISGNQTEIRIYCSKDNLDSSEKKEFSEPLIQKIIGALDNFISTFFNKDTYNNIAHKVIYKSFSINYSSCIEAFVNGKDVISVEGHDINLHDIVPDVTLSFLPILKDITIEKELGKGGFGIVYLGSNSKGKKVKN